VELDPFSPFIHGLAGLALYAIGQFNEAEQATHRALELQPDYLLGLWTRGFALFALNRNKEGVASLERATVLSRAPNFVGVLGLGYARSGRTEDARRLLGELEERSLGGEYVPAFAPLAINVGLGDVPAIRRWLAASLAESTPPLSIGATSGVFLDEFRSDPEIGRLFDQLFHYDRLERSS
jgi:tetratricopeptide (TPR) repeat protein